MLSDPEFNIFYHAPALIVITAAQPTDWAVEDCALAAENLMLAAHAAGLGSCWIGFAQHWLGTPEGKTALGLPPSYSPIAPIPAADFGVKARLARYVMWNFPPASVWKYTKL